MYNNIESLHVNNLSCDTISANNITTYGTNLICEINTLKSRLDYEIENLNTKLICDNDKLNIKLNCLLDFLVVKNVIDDKSEFDEYLKSLDVIDKLSEQQ